MKIDEHILKFPKTLPNDEQQFMIYYPYKFPKVIDYFEKKANELYDKPKEYAEFVQSEYDLLEKEVIRINEEYQSGDKNDLNFLVEIDQKFNKVFCFKFWVINYVFADGPIHEFYVDQLKAFARKMVDVTDDIEEYEERIIRIQRDLLQTDYADIYLVQALHAIKLVEFLKTDDFSKEIIAKVVPLIDERDEKNNEKIMETLKPIVEKMLDKNDDHYKTFRDQPEDFVFTGLLSLPPLVIPINQVNMRKSHFPLYSFLNHAFEFREQNIVLEERYNNMKEFIEEIFVEAKEKFSEEEFADFRLSYDMSKCFSMSKDIMGSVDPILVPVWERDVHDRVFKILSKTQAVRYPSVNHASMFSSFAWYLPDDLKSKVMSVDETDFNN